ncbi:glycosyltransferase family 2 protein [Grimontia sp. SpTr1]|uniref:glycosyltransferase n=1 Tax=Grimontia sp. SpTr1 TaxID=2995319 RepID=UPI00248BF5EE|nr:glycosyltransferase family 2 protein [Grimontia sp. SpTr1]
METNLPIVTVVIATYNSMKMLPRTLDAIFSQNYPKDKLEILLVDGGSTDNTIQYGKERGCKVEHNPRTEPVFAKFVGFNEAKGELLVYLDHDEVYSHSNCLRDQVDCIREYGVKTVISAGYLNPKEEHFINDYINEYGDPFSLFIYRISKSPEVFINDLREKYEVSLENDRYCSVDFGESKPLPLIELLAMGTMIDRTFFSEKFPNVVSVPENLPHLFYYLMSIETKIGICKDHSLYHYSSESIDKYLRKISWRVRNNIHHTDDVGAAGYLMREKMMAKRSGKFGTVKKYLFIPYSILVFPALLDSIYLILHRKKKAFLFHSPLCFYTASQILYHMGLKLLGKKPHLRSYDGKKEIKND